MNPKKLSIADYWYLLPDDRIAKHPLAKRVESRVLVYKSGKITSSTYEELDQFLPETSMLLFNDTKVIEARLLFKKKTGGLVEIFCLEPHEQYSDITSAMMQTKSVLWKCLIGGASKWKPGMKLLKEISVRPGKSGYIEASIVDRRNDCFVIELNWQPPELSFGAVLHLAGAIPLPPYLHREAEDADKERYQTVYAKQDGSVAAPTAGLHFTNELFGKLDKKGIKKAFVTLHVGAGTFMPVKSPTLEQHVMHTEFLNVTTETIQTIIDNLEHPIVAVGTTSLRTVESLYWLGARLTTNPELELKDLIVHQWEPYENESNINTSEALQTLIDKLKGNNVDRLIAKTQILIAPGYKLRVAKGLITNFHQPNSTLLVLIAAIVGEDWKKIYQYALDNNFRFLSYGDGCLLWPNDSVEH